MAEPMRIRASAVNDKVDVKVLMDHAMETGLRRDAKGSLVPAHFIQSVTATHNGKTVLAAQWGTGVSKNPFLHFRFKGGRIGEKVVLTWIDNIGDKRVDEAIVAGG
jgi:sulfur-oxidizing protein SoxZ